MGINNDEGLYPGATLCSASLLRTRLCTSAEIKVYPTHQLTRVALPLRLADAISPHYVLFFPRSLREVGVGGRGRVVPV